MKELYFGIIGCGSIAKKHVHCIEKLGHNIKGLCDKDLSKARDLNVLKKAEIFSDHNDMLKTLDLDVVVVLTPSGLHYEIVKDIAKFGLSIIVEKPISLKLKHAIQMIDLCKENNSALSVVKQNRFNKPVVLARNLLNSGNLGELFLGTVRVRWTRDQEYYDQASWRGSWLNDGGVIANQAIHHIDMLQWFLGDVESVYSKNINALSNIEAEDTSVSVIKFKSGALGVIEATTAIRPRDLEGSVSFLGSKGAAVINGFSMNEMGDLQLEDDSYLNGSNDMLANPKDFAYSHYMFYKSFVENHNNKSPQLVDGREALKSLQIVHAIYKSNELGREIFFDSDDINSRLGT